MEMTKNYHKFHTIGKKMSISLDKKYKQFVTHNFFTKIFTSLFVYNLLMI